MPRHKLPRRTLHRTTPVLWGTAIELEGVPFGAALLPLPY
jgi:hypothetical protein